MDINFKLFSERLRRVLAGEEVTLPDAAKQPIHNLHTEVEIVTSWLSEFEDDISCLLFEKMAEEEIENLDLATVMDEINCFTCESEKVIDTFINNITQQKSQSRYNKDIFDALQGLQSRITEIKQRVQQLKHIDSEIMDEFRSVGAESGYFPASSSSKNRNTVGLDDRMEELLDLLIEGPTQLSVVAMLDSIGLDKTAFTAEAYNSSYVKHYFDYLAWIPAPYHYDPDQILDIVTVILLPFSMLSKIKDKDYEMKKNILGEYLMTKRYLIVLDDVWSTNVLDVVQEILPDNQNGSRVLITLTQIKMVTSFQLENGENIRLDLVPTGGPLRATYQGWPFHILYHGSISLEENIEEVFNIPTGNLTFVCCKLPFHLKLCFLYLSVFPAHLEISTRQLYQLWIAEGFIPDNSETTAGKYLEQLINRGFVDARKRRAGGTINTCSVPGRCRPVLLAVAFKAEFIFFSFMDPEALHPCCCTEDILGRLPNLRNLRIRGDLSYNQSLLSKSLCRLSCLESLKLVNESKMPRLSKIVLAEYLFPHGLTDLSFSNTDLMDDPMPALEKLPLLLVLKLKQNSYPGRKLNCGSDGFPNLKVLHLKSMLWLEEWTMGIGAMPKLECLIINPCAYLKKMPEQLRCIKSLNKFDCWWPQPELRQKLREFEDKEQCGIQLFPYGI
ncbi:NB-ARC domain-containing protein [Citrus sinensis]|uniref:NB-ARC domain-containing protein n=1 Tax=Citrus sinensis TaxID=2711 RepID=A0ACB8NXB3_CITSI|nr:NB-ARC domain-containing protein [Citrus sinensis]